MNAVEVLAAIKAAHVDASGLAAELVLWENEDHPAWLPTDTSALRLNVTTMVWESDPREEQSATETELSTPYRFTVRALAEDLQNTGQALSTLCSMRNRFEFTSYRQVWSANGIVIIDSPLSPVRLDRRVDGRMLAAFATDTRFRAVITDTIAAVTGAIETVNGLGTLQPGDIGVPFTTG